MAMHRGAGCDVTPADVHRHATGGERAPAQILGQVEHVGQREVRGWICLAHVNGDNLWLQLRAGRAADGPLGATRVTQLRTDVSTLRNGRASCDATERQGFTIPLSASAQPGTRFRLDVYVRIRQSRRCVFRGPFDFERLGGRIGHPWLRGGLEAPLSDGFIRDERFPNVSISPPTWALVMAARKTRHAAAAAAGSGSASRGAVQSNGVGAASGGELRFSVCGGLVNQRLSIIDGILIGHLLGYTIVLPHLKPNGRQEPQSGYAEHDARLLPFGSVYDANATIAKLRAIGVAARVASSSATAADSRKALDVRSAGRNAAWFRTQAAADGGRRTLSLGCTFAALNKRRDASLREIFWRVDDALVFAPRIAAAAGKVIARLRQRSATSGGGGAYVALHLRSEPDWVAHCSRWEAPDATPPRDNCLTNTDQLPRVFQLEGVATNRPLFVASEAASEAARQLVATARGGSGGGAARTALGRVTELRGLHRAGYRLSTKDTLLPELMSDEAEREHLAAVDYAVSAAADAFVGNSVSSFSAMLLLHRRHRERRGVKEGAAEAGSVRDDFHYNGGSIPLQDVLFGDGDDDEQAVARQARLMWVFTLSGAEGRAPAYDEMAKVAVISCLRRTTLIPVCVFWGEPNAMTAWLTRHGVRVLFHEPKWQVKIGQAATRAQQRGLASLATPLFEKPQHMLATFLRLDLPTMGFVRPFVLYADVDVLFMRDITLADFAPLPSHYAIGPEATPGMVSLAHAGRRIAYGNAGVMLINLPAMARTYKRFVRWVFSPEHLAAGLHFGVFGPVDQGAFNEFYQGKFDLHTYPTFNHKPYWGHDPAAKLVHFHGPKRADYANYLHNRSWSGSPLFLSLLRGCTRRSGCSRYLDIYDKLAREVRDGKTAP